MTPSTTRDQAERPLTAADDPVQERDPALVDAVAQRREDRGQDRDRGEHRHRDDGHRRDRERGEGRVAAEQHPGHRRDHRHPGDEHGAARGRRRGRQGRLREPPGPCARRARGAGRTASSRRPTARPTRTTTAETLGSIGTSWLGNASRPIVASTAEKPAAAAPGPRPGRRRRARRMISVTGSEVVSALLRSSLKTASRALLALASPNCSIRSRRVTALRGRDRGEAGVDLFFRRFVVAGELEFDQRRVAVGGHLAAAVDRRADPAHRRHRGDAAGGVGDRGLGSRDRRRFRPCSGRGRSRCWRSASPLRARPRPGRTRPTPASASVS